MTTPYTPWSTRSQFKAVEPRPVVICRIQYQCRSAGYAGTDYARRPAPGRSRYLPGMQFVAAVLRAPLTLFSLARIQFCQEPMRSLAKRFGAFSVRVAHDEQHEWKGVGSDTQAVGEFRNVER